MNFLSNLENFGLFWVLFLDASGFSKLHTYGLFCNKKNLETLVISTTVRVQKSHISFEDLYVL